MALPALTAGVIMAAADAERCMEDEDEDEDSSKFPEFDLPGVNTCFSSRNHGHGSSSSSTSKERKDGSIKEFSLLGEPDELA